MSVLVKNKKRGKSRENEPSYVPRTPSAFLPVARVQLVWWTVFSQSVECACVRKNKQTKERLTLIMYSTLAVALVSAVNYRAGGRLEL